VPSHQFNLVIIFRGLPSTLSYLWSVSQIFPCLSDRRGQGHLAQLQQMISTPVNTPADYRSSHCGWRVGGPSIPSHLALKEDGLGQRAPKTERGHYARKQNVQWKGQQCYQWGWVVSLPCVRNIDVDAHKDALFYLP
jgi:hypothetical protein